MVFKFTKQFRILGMKFSEILKCAEIYLFKFDDALEFEDCKISRMILILRGASCMSSRGAWQDRI